MMDNVVEFSKFPRFAAVVKKLGRRKEPLTETERVIADLQRELSEDEKKVRCAIALAKASRNL